MSVELNYMQTFKLCETTDLLVTGPLSVFLFLICLFYLFIIFGCVGSSLLRAGFLQLQRAGAALRCGARASHCAGFSCCGAWALGVWASVWLMSCRAQAQQLWRTGLVAPRHVGSSRTRARTPVPCIGRQILNHCATREAPFELLKLLSIVLDDLS